MDLDRDGSIDLAYNTTNGESARLFRTGTVAWTGLAAVTYKRITGNSRYDALAKSAANWLLTQQGSDGLPKGGPDVKWVSTQNNIVASQFLRQYAGTKRSTYNKQGDVIAAAVTDKLLVDGRFVQGVDDNVHPADVQALGALLLQQTGDSENAKVVLENMIKDDRVDNISIDFSPT